MLLTNLHMSVHAHSIETIADYMHDVIN